MGEGAAIERRGDAWKYVTESRRVENGWVVVDKSQVWDPERM